MTPEEIMQLANEKLAMAISIYEAIRGNNVRSEATGGQGIIRNAGSHVVRVKKGYLGNQPYCRRCEKHHFGRCTIICWRCQKRGHKAKNCRIVTPVTSTVPAGVCYECGELGYYKNSCPRIREIQERARLMIPKRAVRVNNVGEGYKGRLPFCVKCNTHHIGYCTVICNRCKKTGHKAKDCEILAPVPITALPITCNGYREIRHFQGNYSVLRQQNTGSTREKICIIANEGNY